MEKELEEFLRAKKLEGLRHRRKLEVYGGAALVLASLAMAVVFLLALGYSQTVLFTVVVSAVFLIAAVLLFAKGLWTIVVGGKKTRL